MRILDRYIGFAVTGNVLITLFLLVSLAGFFSFLGQMDSLMNAYGVPEAVWYVLLTLPRRAYELFPTAVLIGALFGLGTLANHNEIVIIRASGVSVRRIVWSVLKAGLVLMVFAAILGEGIAPVTEQKAQKMKTDKQSGFVSLKSRYGFWTRDDLHFIKVKIVVDSSQLKGIRIFTFDQNRKLRSVIEAKSAKYRDGQWYLNDVQESRLENERVKIRKIVTDRWGKLINRDLLTVLSVKPETLSAWSLWKLEKHVRVKTGRYEVAFWIKIFTPLSTLVMLIVAIPFVFNAVRSTNTGQRLLIGMLLGMGFYLVNQAFSQFGVVFGFPAFLSAALPSILFAGAGLYVLKKIS